MSAPSEQHLDHAECSYRRGCHQTACHIYDGLVSGATVEQIGQLVDELGKWRSDRQGKYGFSPPTLCEIRRGQQ